MRYVFPPKSMPPLKPMKKRPSFLRRALWRLFKYFSFLFAIGVLSVVGVIWYFSKDLPHINEIFLSYRRPCIRVFSDNKTLLATYGDVYGEMVSVNDLPKHVPEALMAIEDKRFYHHFGIDLMGIARALWVNYHSGGVVQGGSTITQQLGKNILQAHKMYGYQDRSIKRKIQETILALLLEAKLSKDQIMTLYLNRVYFGAGAFGIDAAAMRYFGRHARQLTLYESAMLMGLLKAPSRYSPAQNPEKSEERARQVLLKMIEAGFITQKAMDLSLMMASPPPNVTNTSSVHYFADWVIDSVRHLVSLDQDLDIYTTLDLNLQELAHQKMKVAMKQYGEKWKAGQMALVSMTPQGAVKAMVGGTSYAITKFNRATQALRQSGSLFKFFAYLTAFENGLTPEHLIPDTQVSFDGWQPKNYLYKSQGEVTLRRGFAKSINTAVVRLVKLLGLARVVQTARKLGITTPIPYNLSIALGSGEVTLLEVTGAFAVIANHGRRVLPHGIKRVQSKKGHVLYRWEPSEDVVVSPYATNAMLDAMQAVVKQGTGWRTNIDRPSACKTGTSQQYRDLWLVGFTPELVTGVWTGRDSDQPLTHSTVGSPSSHLWRDFMKAALRKTAISRFYDVPLDRDPPVFSEEQKTVESVLYPATTPEDAPSDQAFGGWEKGASATESAPAAQVGSAPPLDADESAIDQAIENRFVFKGKKPDRPVAPKEDRIGALLHNSHVQKGAKAPFTTPSHHAS